MADRAAVIADLVPVRRQGTMSLLGIDGRSGAGKTTLAADVATQLDTCGRAVQVLSMDELYAGWHGLAGVAAVLCRDVIEPLRLGLTPHVRRYDWQREDFGSAQALRVEDVLILEGVGSTKHPCRWALDTAVWVQAPREVRRARALGRRGQGDFAAHVSAWEAQEDALFGLDSYPHPPPGYDLVVQSPTGQVGA